MGLTDYQQNMIKFIAENNIREAKKWALLSLEEDKTTKNQYFVNRYKNILSTDGSNIYMLPADLQDILCCEDVSTSFREGRYYVTTKEREIADNIFRMAKVSQKLMELQIPYKNATLLYGPPGTGKTMFGRYIAFKMGLPFCYLNFSKVVDSYMGATSRNIAKAFTYAASNHCVFMLDEVDAISVNRNKINSSSGISGEMSRITITLMQEFDKLPNNVIVIAATNKIGLLDDAFISRCPLIYRMNPFKPEDSKAMIEAFLADVGVELNEHDKTEALLGHDDADRDQRAVMGRLIRKITEKLERDGGLG